MAFLRVEKKKSGTYLRIVQSFKQAGKAKHKTLYSLGKVEDYSADQLEAIGKKLIELAGKSFEDLTNDLKELGRFNYGFPLIVNWLWGRFAIEPFIKKKLKKRKIAFDFSAVLRLLICERLSDPASKLCSYRRQNNYIGLNHNDLQHFYRTMDVMDDIAEPLQKHLYLQQRDLFNQSLDLVFYDVTTLYFDSEKQVKDKLRQKGYSKDGKAHKLQVVLGLMVDKMRNPIGYQLYQGNQYEGKTLEDSITKLRKEYQIDKIIVVTDRGMMNKGNLQAIADHHYDFIIGERLKNLPKDIKDKLIDKAQHTSRSDNEKKEKFTYRQINYQDKRIICTWSEKRERKDAFEREKLIEKAKALLANPSKIKQKNKRGAKRYLEFKNEEQVGLDEKKIMLDEKYDGFLAISTNRKDLSVDQILSQYTNLFEVEHAFRTLKSVLEIRPVYHWNDKRINGHVALCFLSYMFLNFLTKSLKISEWQLCETLEKMQLSKIKQSKNEDPFYLRSSIDEQTQQIIDKLKLLVPKDTTPQTLVNQYFTN